jgi:hypothetical protein
LGGPDNPTSGIGVSAWGNDSSGAVAIVAFNETNAAVTQKFVLNGVSVPSVTPWETSDAVKLTAREAVPVAGGGFSWPIPGMSVITFVGRYSPSGIRAGRAGPAEMPYRNLSLGADALTADIRGKAGFSISVYDLEGARVGAYSGRGSGKIRVALRPGPAGMYLVKFVAEDGKKSQARVFRGN